MLDYKSIGKRVRFYRKQKGFTQEQLGLNINTSGAYISNIERAVKKPSLENLVAMAEALDITVDDIITPSHNNTDYTTGLESLIVNCSSGTRSKIRSSLYFSGEKISPHGQLDHPSREK